MTEAAMELLKMFNMEHLAEHRAGSLPYGQQRKLEICRALATQPKLLLLDEPAAGMNPTETRGADGDHPLHPQPFPDLSPSDRT